MNQRCREFGLYPHSIEQWRHDFLSLATKNTLKDDALELKKLKQEFAETKKDLNRKNKALAEAAALLVLQKKVCASLLHAQRLPSLFCSYCLPHFLS
jgi:transposase-like protein